MTSMLQHFIFIANFMTAVTISHLDVTAQIPQEQWKHLNYCAFAGLDTKTPLAASYKASGYFTPAIMEKIPF